MFKLAKGEKIVWWPVTVQVPGDGGRSSQHKIDVQYEVLPQTELDAIVGDTETFFERVVCDWKQVADEDGNTLSCTAENKKTLFDVPYVRSAILAGYFDAAIGGRRKN